MSTTPAPVRASRVVAIGCSATAGLALVSLIGWAIEQPLLRRGLEGAPPTTPLTALVLLLLVAGVETRRRAAKRVANGCFLVVVALASWTLVQYALALGPDIETLLFAGATGGAMGDLPGRPSPHTAVTVLLLAAAGIILGRDVHPRPGLAHALVGAALVVPWFAIFGYATATSPFYALAAHPQTGISPITAIATFGVGAGIAWLAPAAGLPRLLASDSTGGVVTRALLPVCAGAPLVLCWLATSEGAATRAHLVLGTWGAASLLTAGLVVFLGVRLDRTDLKRRRLIGELEVANETIAAFNETLSRRVAETTQALAQERNALREHAAMLEQSNLELQEFAFVTSHDLRAPLLRVRSFNQLALERPAVRGDHVAADWLRNAATESAHLAQLVDDVLEYSRIDRGTRPFDKVPLADLLAELAAELEPELAEVGGTIELGPLPEIFGDRVQIAQLYRNLLSNAVKFRGERPLHIRLHAHVDGPGWAICLDDTGIGIDPEHREQIFQMFRRLHDPDAYPGSGIGLAICRRVVSRHGGTLRVEDSPLGGSRLVVWLPSEGATRGGDAT